MFVATLAPANPGTTTPQYVTGYTVANLAVFNKKYKGQDNVIFISERYMRGKMIQTFINHCTAFYLGSNGKLILDTTKL